MTHPFEIENEDGTVSYIPDAPVPVPVIPPGTEKVPPPEPEPAPDTLPEAPAVSPEGLGGAPLGGEGPADADLPRASADDVTPTPDGA